MPGFFTRCDPGYAVDGLALDISTDDISQQTDSKFDSTTFAADATEDSPYGNEEKYVWTTLHILFTIRGQTRTRRGSYGKKVGGLTKPISAKMGSWLSNILSLFRKVPGVKEIARFGLKKAVVDGLCITWTAEKSPWSRFKQTGSLQNRKYKFPVKKLSLIIDTSLFVKLL